MTLLNSRTVAWSTETSAACALLFILCREFGTSEGAITPGAKFNHSFLFTETQFTRRNLVIGGQIADISTYPWAVVIGAMQGSEIAGHCTGSLLTRGTVLTAAHCVFNENGRLVMPLSSLRVTLGATAWTEATVTVSVDSAEAPSWRGWVGDFAVLFLSKCLPLSQPTVKLATSRGSHDKDRGKVFLVGWGVSNTLKLPWAMSTNLRHLPTTIGTESACRSVALSWQLVYQSDKELCFAPENGKGICSGDSGAPVVARNLETQEWIQVGVTAYGPAVCGQGPDFAARVSFYANEILGIVKKDPCVKNPNSLAESLLYAPRGSSSRPRATTKPATQPPTNPPEPLTSPPRPVPRETEPPIAQTTPAVSPPTKPPAAGFSEGHKGTPPSKHPTRPPHEPTASPTPGQAVGRVTVGTPEWLGEDAAGAKLQTPEPAPGSTLAGPSSSFPTTAAQHQETATPTSMPHSWADAEGGGFEPDASASSATAEPSTAPPTPSPSQPGSGTARADGGSGGAAAGETTAPATAEAEAPTATPGGAPPAQTRPAEDEPPTTEPSPAGGGAGCEALRCGTGQVLRRAPGPCACCWPLVVEVMAQAPDGSLGDGWPGRVERDVSGLLGAQEAPPMVREKTVSVLKENSSTVLLSTSLFLLPPRAASWTAQEERGIRRQLAVWRFPEPSPADPGSLRYVGAHVHRNATTAGTCTVFDCAQGQDLLLTSAECSCVWPIVVDIQSEPAQEARSLSLAADCFFDWMAELPGIGSPLQIALRSASWVGDQGPGSEIRMEFHALPGGSGSWEVSQIDQAESHLQSWGSLSSDSPCDFQITNFSVRPTQTVPGRSQESSKAVSPEIRALAISLASVAGLLLTIGASWLFVVCFVHPKRRDVPESAQGRKHCAHSGGTGHKRRRNGVRHSLHVSLGSVDAKQGLVRGMVGNYRSSLVSNQMNHRVDDQTAATSPSTPSTITASPNQTPFLPNSYHPRHNTRPHAVHPAEIVQIPRSAARLAPIGSSHHAKSNSEETFSSEMLSSPQQEKFAAPVHPLGASLNFS